MTESEKEIYALIANFRTEHGYSPTVREIADQYFCSPKYIHSVLVSLKEKGYINYQERKVRTIVINGIS